MKRTLLKNKELIQYTFCFYDNINVKTQMLLTALSFVITGVQEGITPKWVKVPRNMGKFIIME